MQYRALQAAEVQRLGRAGTWGLDTHRHEQEEREEDDVEQPDGDGDLLEAVKRVGQVVQQDGRDACAHAGLGRLDRLAHE